MTLTGTIISESIRPGAHLTDEQLRFVKVARWDLGETVGPGQPRYWTVLDFEADDPAADDVAHTLASVHQVSDLDGNAGDTRAGQDRRKWCHRCRCAALTPQPAITAGPAGQDRRKWCPAYLPDLPSGRTSPLSGRRRGWRPARARRRGAPRTPRTVPRAFLPPAPLDSRASVRDQRRADVTSRGGGLDKTARPARNVMSSIMSGRETWLDDAAATREPARGAQGAHARSDGSTRCRGTAARR
jgi:hypothetical protein